MSSRFSNIGAAIGAFCATAMNASPLLAENTATTQSARKHTIAVDAKLSQHTLKRGQSQRVFLKIDLRGRPEYAENDRTPANIALVIDRSGSMSGQKIVKAREAAKMAIDRLERKDIASVIVFDNRVDRLVAARHVREHGLFHDHIDSVRPRGSTAIYAAVTAAAQEIRRNASPGRLNRIVLLSDGLANVGPKHPRQFEALGQRLGGEGISVSTIGLGHRYNEDLMAQLAAASDGNHAYARTAADLEKIFGLEFDEVLSVCGQDVDVIIHTRDGVQPLRALGREARIDGDTIRIRLSQIYGTAAHSLLIELKTDGRSASASAPIADISVAYTSQSKSRRRIATRVIASYSDADDVVHNSVNRSVMEPVLELKARERSRQAIKLHDSGRVEEARKALRHSAERLEKERREYRIDSRRLDRIIANTRDAARAAPSASQWNASRKQLREDQSNRQGAGVKY